MAYEPENLKEMEIGREMFALVSEINEGVLEDFVDMKKYDSKGTANPEHPTICVKCENGAECIVKMPKDGVEVHPKSTLGRWKKTYGAYPAVGQKVKTYRDENGFEQVLLRE